MKKSHKNEMLHILSKNLEIFYPHLKQHFMCPTCLEKIPLIEKDRISEAHIIPNAAGGTWKTFLCRDCNSRFGAKQDKWFGEFINITNGENPSLFSTTVKNRYFKIDNLKVNGSFKQEKTGDFSLYIHTNRNSPDVNKIINEKLSTYPTEIKLSVQMPILQNARLAEVGFLTAGYLMWFRALGYSWILQSHLNIVREQIIKPDKNVIYNKFFFNVGNINWKPWFGIIPIDNNYMPAFGLKNHLVAFPSRGYPFLYENIDEGARNINLSDIRAQCLSNKLLKQPAFPAFVVMYENNILVAPDLLENLKDSFVVILFTKDSNKAQMLVPIEKNKFEELKKQNNAKVICVKWT